MLVRLVSMMTGVVALEVSSDVEWRERGRCGFKSTGAGGSISGPEYYRSVDSALPSIFLG
jgi:hypothetical protein